MDHSQHQHVIGMFAGRHEAERAVQRLNEAGVGVDAISVAMRHDVGEASSVLTEAAVTHDLGDDGSAVGAVSGAAVGTLVGLLVAGSTIVLPGVGPFLVAGPLVAALTGAGVGAASGGLLGALVGSGIPENEAPEFLAGVEAGRVIVVAHVNEPHTTEARTIFRNEGAQVTQTD